MNFDPSMLCRSADGFLVFSLLVWAFIVVGVLAESRRSHVPPAAPRSGTRTRHGRRRSTQRVRLRRAS